jgi:erythromycin esterase
MHGFHSVIYPNAFNNRDPLMRLLKHINRLARSCIALSCVFATACTGIGSGRLATPASTPAVAAEVTWLTQNAHEVTNTNPADEDFSDLQSFGNAIGDAQIVTLAEPTHGSGTVFDMKMRLIKYLHQEKGFSVVMLGAGVFGAFRMDQLAQNGSTLDAVAPDELADVYAKSVEVRRLLQYLDAHRSGTSPLLFTGMDSHQSGKYARVDLIPMLENYLASSSASNAGVLQLRDWTTYKEQVLKITRGIPTPPAADIQASFYSVSGALETQLCAAQTDTLKFPDSPGLWCRIVGSLHNQADRFWKGKANRDIDMAANAHWLAEHPYKGRKIIIWADMTRLGNYGSGADASMGSELKRYYGEKIYTAGFTASQGTDSNLSDLSTTYNIVADRADSLEAVLHTLNKAHLFIDTRRTNPPDSLSILYSKELGFRYVDGTTTMLGRGYDGLFYHQTTHALTINR